MNDESIRRDWLEQTWEIKRSIAEEYAGKPASQQIREMRELVQREWKERGWTLKEKCFLAAPK